MNDLVDAFLRADRVLRRALAREVPVSDVLPVLDSLSSQMGRYGCFGWSSDEVTPAGVQSVRRAIRLALEERGRWLLVRRRLREAVTYLGRMVGPITAELEEVGCG